MPVTMKDLGLDRLSRDERVALAEELLASAAAETPPGSRLTEEQKRELDRRIAEADADPDGGIPWEQVKAEIEDRLKQIRS